MQHAVMRRLSGSLLFLIFSLPAAAWLAFHFDAILVGNHHLSFSPSTILNALTTNSNVMKFFILFSIVMLCVLFYIVFASMFFNYKSKMLYITPDISIPAPVGQGQYGTARFLQKKAYDNAFGSVAVTSTDHRIVQLVRANNIEEGTS